MSEYVDVVIIGAGPAGMAAASEVSAKGLSTIVLDENVSPGGQIYRAVEAASARQLDILGEDYAAGKALVEEFRSSGAEYLPGALVWNIGTDMVVEYSRNGKSRQVRAGAIVAATGALERPCPVPGWTLPGVTTAGALQILLKTSGIIYEDAVLVGSGPLLWLLAAQMVDAGTPPKAVVENLPRGRALAALPYLAKAFSGRGYLFKGLSLIKKVRGAGVPVHRNATGISVKGEKSATAVCFVTKGAAQRIETDTVALHQGVVPNQQVTRLMRCRHFWDRSQHCFRPELNDMGETSVANLYVAGDGGGIEGAKSAEMQGRLVGIGIAERAGRKGDGTLDRLRDALRREASVRPFLEALYAPAPEIVSPADSTIVCRCEEITAGAVREAVDLGAPGPNQVKSFLRTGMGPCQGRVCGLSVSGIIAERRNQDPQIVDYYRIRPPLKPLPLAELADYGPDDAEQAPAA